MPHKEKPSMYDDDDNLYGDDPDSRADYCDECGADGEYDCQC
jgi:hypothetical protein